MARYFPTDQVAIEALEARRDATASELDGFVDEHSGEDGLLEDAKNDKGAITKAGVKARLKTIEFESDSEDEYAALLCCLELIEAEAEAGTAVKDAQAESTKRC